LLALVVSMEAFESAGLGDIHCAFACSHSLPADVVYNWVAVVVAGITGFLGLQPSDDVDVLVEDTLLRVDAVLDIQA